MVGKKKERKIIINKIRSGVRGWWEKKERKKEKKIII